MKTRTIRALALLATLTAVCASCEKTSSPATKGDGVLFSGSIGRSESGTKTVYAGDHTASSATAESINWVAGDKVRIWCRECSEPTTDTYGKNDHFADYTVTPGTTSAGSLTVEPNTVGLRWGDAGKDHWFYAVYPSPKTTGKGDDTGELGTPAEGTQTSFTFTGHIPATQAIVGDLTTTQTTESGKTVTTTVAAPDMSNLYMVSKADAKPEDAGGEVFLTFTPLSTAIEFVIQNDMTADNAMMQVESVKIMSDPRPESGTTAKNLSGAFSTTLSDAWAVPPTVTGPAGSGILGTYSNEYPTCTEGTTGMSSEVSISFKNTAAYTPGIAKGDRLQFTFFLLPTQSVDDLSFVIKREDGTTIKTRLEMSDGGKIPFPKHKKTYVKGILVPDGAMWTVSFDPKVTPWGDNAGGSADGGIVDPITDTDPIVTSWETVEFTPEFQ